MKISKSRLVEIARDFYDFLEKSKFSSVGGLKKAKRRFNIREFPETFVKIGARPSYLNSTAYRVSYIITPKEGIPLELVFNNQLGYFQVIAKSEEKIPGFKYFPIPSEDVFGNRHQYKVVFCEDIFSEAKKELGRLGSCEMIKLPLR